MKHISSDKFYNIEYAEMYDQKPISRISRLKKYFNLSQNFVVADFGCGNAMLLDVIHDMISEYHGVDMSEYMIASAAKRAQNIKNIKIVLKCQKISVFSEYNISKFDAAFALDFSEHVNDLDWLNILGCIKKSLKYNGKLYIHTPNGAYFIELFKKHGIINQMPEHIAVRNIESNIKIIKDAGFSNIKIIKLPHYENRQKLFHLLSFIPYVGRIFNARLLIIATNI